MNKKARKLKNVLLLTDVNGQEYIRINKSTWMLYCNDDQIMITDHLEKMFAEQIKKSITKKTK